MVMDVMGQYGLYFAEDDYLSGNFSIQLLQLLVISHPLMKIPVIGIDDTAWEIWK